MKLSKNELIVEGKYKEFLFFRKQLYLAEGIDHNNKELYKDYFGENVDTLFSIANSIHQRKNRNRNDILKWIFAIRYILGYKNYKLIFGTLTFNDSVLRETLPNTRRRYVNRFLNENTVHYQANIDFGDSKGREHYHFIAICEDKLDKSKWRWNSNFKEIPIKSNDIKSVFNYVLKLNNHSFKDSTRQERILKDKHKYRIEDIIDIIYPEEFAQFKIKFNNNFVDF